MTKGQVRFREGDMEEARRVKKGTRVARKRVGEQPSIRTGVVHVGFTFTIVIVCLNTKRTLVFSPRDSYHSTEAIFIANC